MRNTRYTVYFKGKDGYWRTGGYVNEAPLKTLIKIYQKHKIKSIVRDDEINEWFVVEVKDDDMIMSPTKERIN